MEPRIMPKNVGICRANIFKIEGVCLFPVHTEHPDLFIAPPGTRVERYRMLVKAINDNMILGDTHLRGGAA